MARQQIRCMFMRHVHQWPTKNAEGQTIRGPVNPNKGVKACVEIAPWNGKKVAS